MQNNVMLSIVPSFVLIYKGDRLISWLRAAFFAELSAKHFLCEDVAVNCTA